MKKIYLSKEQVAIVDDDVYRYLIAYKWSAQWSNSSHSFYAIRGYQDWNGKYNRVLMHRSILEYHGYDLTDLEVHHKNEDSLDNRLDNLVVLTKAQHIKLHRDMYRLAKETALKDIEEYFYTTPYELGVKRLVQCVFYRKR